MEKKVVQPVNGYTYVFMKNNFSQTGNTLGYEKKLCNDHVFILGRMTNDHNDGELMDLPVRSL
jgi:hypothetical protein